MKQKLLELLQSTEGFLSGQELSDYLNVSRTAVWKVMKSLEGGRIRDRGSAK